MTVRANTVAGNLPALEYGTRIFTYGSNPPNDQIRLHNNIWSDPTGTMGDTFNRGSNTNHLTFDNNLFWNNGQPFPTSAESMIEVSDDAHRVVGNPLLGSPAIDAADPVYTPSEDILGRPRPVGVAPDLGAYEFRPSLELTEQPGDKHIRLTWTLDTTLPSTSTWRIVYTGPVGDQPSPITGLGEPVRTYTLTGLTNYTWYTVTLNAMVDSGPYLTATLTAMPTDRFVYLPLVLCTGAP